MKVVQGKSGGFRSKKKKDTSSRNKCYVPRVLVLGWTAGGKQERLEVVAASVKATTAATRNKSKSQGSSTDQKIWRRRR